MKKQPPKKNVFEIKKCRSGDFEEVVLLLRELWPDKPMDRRALWNVYRQALASKASAHVCVVKAGHPIAFGSFAVKYSLWQEGLLAHIDELVVHQDYRGQGIGIMLLKYLETLAKRKGCRRVELDSAFHRKEAHKFYGRRGFESRAFLFSKLL